MAPRERRRRTLALAVAGGGHLLLLSLAGLTIGSRPSSSSVGVGVATVTLMGADALTGEGTTLSGSVGDEVDAVAENEWTPSPDDLLAEVSATGVSTTTTSSAEPPSGSSPAASASAAAAGGELVDNPWSRAAFLPRLTAPADPAIALRMQAARCWTGSQPSGPVTLSIVVDDRGSIIGPPTPVRVATQDLSEEQRLAEERATRALTGCAPYTLIAAAGQREILEITFNP